MSAVENNKQIVLEAIESGAKTRRDIEAQTGLSYTIVCDSVMRLISEGALNPDDIQKQTSRSEKASAARLANEQKKKNAVLQAINDGNTIAGKIREATGFTYGTIHKYIIKLIEEKAIDPSILKHTYSLTHEEGKQQEDDKETNTDASDTSIKEEISEMHEDTSTTMEISGDNSEAYASIDVYAQKLKSKQLSSLDAYMLGDLISTTPSLINIKNVKLAITAFLRTYRKRWF